MDFIGILIVGVIIAVISSALKQSKNQKTREQQRAQQQQRARQFQNAVTEEEPPREIKRDEERPQGVARPMRHQLNDELSKKVNDFKRPQPSPRPRMVNTTPAYEAKQAEQVQRKPTPVFSPGDLRRAVIMNEVLTRPQERRRLRQL